MNADLRGVLLVLAAYAIGAIPWGVVLGRTVGGVDIRRLGSGGTGATNAQRILGWRVGLPVLVLDFLKGFLPILVGERLGVGAWWLALAAVAAVVGHCWSPYIGFTGGKGVATAAGAATALCPQVLFVVPVVAAVVAITRYVSLGSLTACALATIGTAWLAGSGRVGWSVPVAIAAMSAIVFLRHEGNIRRLASGTERRLGERVKTGGSPT